MKRCEMVRILGESFQKWIDDDYINEGEVFSKVLTDIENAGMLPPLVLSKSFTMSESGEMIYNVNEWEE